MRIVCVLAFLVFGAAPALAHDHWINAGRYRSPVDGTLCCGSYDCEVMGTEAVAATPTGYRLSKGGVFWDGEIVPYGETLTSEDGDYHRCHRPDGSRRCFFAPQPGS